jgi:LysM repeat protein
LVESFKLCPICEARNHQAAGTCHNCGTALQDVAPVKRAARTDPTRFSYDFRYGETDLLEASVTRPARVFTSVLLLLMLAAGLGAGVFFILPQFMGDDAPFAVPLLDDQPDKSTPTPRPTRNAPTVTLGPPTATRTYTPSATFTPSNTPTRAPCIQRIVQGGSLLGAIANCGHRDRDVMPTVMALNDLADANQVRIGQELIIPWPTSSPDPAQSSLNPNANGQRVASNDAADDNAADDNAGDDALTSFTLDESLDPFAPTATPTLPPGIMWHRIGAGENMIAVALRYNTDAKVLSEINPEIRFSQCEFGVRFGGPECIVQLGTGQLVRVPAPTPMPTLSPTPDPNATSTPTPTATFNEPSAISPENRAFFGVDQLVTLRWVPSATLRAGEVYRVDVTDLEIGVTYTAFTEDISFVVPPSWQGREEIRHEFSWTVGVVDESKPDDIRFPTEARVFVWQGITETN